MFRNKVLIYLTIMIIRIFRCHFHQTVSLCQIVMMVFTKLCVSCHLTFFLLNLFIYIYELILVTWFVQS